MRFVIKKNKFIKELVIKSIKINHDNLIKTI